ncbi:MAG TPA: baseplate J/gp47 family protein [Bacillota bacterium]|nr:baseplate J/gp47 family protein [Bacillota bacterium]
MEIKVYPITEEYTLEDVIRIIRESPARRIVLLVETSCPALKEPINLRLLRFYSDERQVELVVIARDPAIRREAEREGLYRSGLDQNRVALQDPQLALEFAANAENGPPKLSRQGRSRTSGRPAVFGRLMTATVVALMTVLTGAYLLFAPRVSIVAYPKVENRALHIEAQVSPAFTAKMLEEDRLPGRVIERRCEAEYSVAATGSKTIGFRAASGNVTFFNGNSKPVIVPKGTELDSKSGIAYLTVKDLLVPAKKRKTLMNVITGENYGQADVPVEAVQKGKRGNLPRNSLTKIQGKLGKILQVTNFAPIMGGEDREFPIVTEADLERCSAELNNQMSIAAPDEVRRSVGEGYLFLPELVTARPLELTPTCKAGDEQEQVSVKLVYAVKATIIDKVILSKYINMKYRQNLPTFLAPAGGMVRILSISAQPGRGHIHAVSLQVETPVKGRLDKNRIIGRVVGKSLREAGESLSALPEVGRFKIQAPGMTHMPRFRFQIRVILPRMK